MRRVARCGVALLVLSALTAPAHPPIARNAYAGGTPAASGDWPHFGNTTDQTRFSPLAQISAANVRQLGVAWTLPEGQNLALWETDPVVVGGIMYLTTGTDQVIAVRADTGATLWRYTPQVNFLSLLADGGTDTPVNRGVEVAAGKVYLLTYDDQLIALDAYTGRLRWHTTIADPLAGYTAPSPPTYWHGMLFVGTAGGDSGARGFVAAYDAETGRQIWRYYTVPAPGHGWMPSRGAHGGGAVWMPPAIDTTSGMLYFGTGNASPDFDARLRPGCNRWTDAIVALDARTGRFRWARTLICPDAWDYDADQTPLLITITRQGARQRVVGVGDKAGYYWLFNAATGALVAKSPPLARQSAPRPLPTGRGVYVCPGRFGGLEYSPPAYSPATGTVYLPGLNMCMIYRQDTAATRRHAPGSPDLGGSAVPSGPATGFMAAIDARTGALRWRTAVPKPMIGGALATAGGLVFSGADDGRFYAFDARTGAILWKVDLGLGFGAAPITYAIGDTQYIAIAAGGSSITQASGAPIGGTLVVFKLHGAPIHTLPTLK